jgi:hypothetical protein
MENNESTNINQAILRIVSQYNHNQEDYHDNMRSFLNIMQNNILIELINKILNNESSWELNNYIDILESILYFNKKIKEMFFYGFEIFYLIQLPYLRIQ